MIKTRLVRRRETSVAQPFRAAPAAPGRPEGLRYLKPRAFVACALVVAATFLLPARPAAHPAATTDVAIAVAGSRVDVTITADAAALRLKLDALQRPIDACVDLRFDGARAGLAPAGVTTLDAGRLAVRLAGTIPDGARAMTWSASFIYGSYPVVIRVGGAGGETTEWLQGPQTTAAIALGSGAAGVPPLATRVAQATALGYTHILPNGLDHVLFVLGLFLLTPGRRAVVAQVTAFTAAHSITLGLTLYGLVGAPPSIVEPLIALSIAYVAIENLITSELRTSRLALVFAFGLLHGMGFAEALTRLHLARPELLTTLVGFNVGVEAGQLTLVAAASLVVALWALPPDRYRRIVVRPVSAGIALAGVAWTIQRIL